MAEDRTPGRPSPGESAARARWSERPLAQLTLLRFREFIREPEALFWSLAFPILLASGLGVAFRNEAPSAVPVGAVTAELADALAQDSGLRVERLRSTAAAFEALRLGEVALLVEPGPDGGVEFHYDDTNPDGRAARMLAEQAVQRAAGRTDPVAVEDVPRREPGSRYIDFLVPGLVGMGIMGNSMFGLGFSIVDARRRKLMKRIMATPMRRSSYLLSFLLWRMVLLPVEVGLPVLFGALAFGVPVRGNPIALGVITIMGSLSFSALALLVGSRARTIEAVSGLMNVVMLPMWLLSGVFFSAERFPEAVQPFIHALPLTALVDAVRANMLQGTGLTGLGAPMATLVAWGLACFATALKLFRWR